MNIQYTNINNSNNNNINNSNNSQYIFSNDNHVSFKCINNSWSRVIEPNDQFRLNGVIKSSFYFKYRDGSGLDCSINVSRFIKAMGESFRDYDMLLSVLNISGGSGNGPYLSYIKNDYQQVLEIEEKTNESIDNCYDNIYNTLPVKISNSIKNDSSNNDAAIKIGIFKLTTFKDGFTIGFVISHSIFDQASISNYIKYLSQVYSLGSLDKITLNKPYFINYSDFKSKDNIINSRSSANEYAKNIGFTYPLNPQLFELNTEIDLEFNLDEIDALKNIDNNSNNNNSNSNSNSNSNNNSSYNSNNSNNTHSYNNQKSLNLSRNDIITAVLFKLFTYTSLLKDQDIYNLKYACNIRNHLGLDQESIGNIYIHCCIPLRVSDIRDLSIIELAKISRASVNQISSDQFKSDLVWYNYIYNSNNNINNSNIIDINQYFIPTIYTTIISNWNQFNYDQIIFNNVSPFTLKTISKASVGTNFISFNTKSNNNNKNNNSSNNNQKVYTTSISIPPDSIISINQLSNITKLFKIINQSNK